MAGSMLSRADRCLLTAACSEPITATRAWREWLKLVDIESHHDADVYGLLPEIGRKLEAAGVDDLHVSLLQGVQRRTWFDNRITIRDGLHACDLIGEAGLEHLVILGAGLTAGYLQPPSVRPLQNFDVLVEPGARANSQDLLQSAGWKVVSGWVTPSSERGFRTVLRSPNGRHVTLQTELLASDGRVSCWPSVRDLAVDGELDGRNVLVPGPSQQLLSTCAPSGALYTQSLLQRVHDAVPVLQSPHVINPDEVVRMATDCNVVVAVETVLTALNSVVAGLVTEELESAIRLARRASWEQREMYRRQSGRNVRRRFWKLWYDHRRSAGSTGLVSLMAGFPSFLRARWDLVSLWQIPGRGLSSLRRAAGANGRS